MKPGAKNIFKKLQKGFTLIEILIVAFVFSLVIVGLMEVFVLSLKSQRYNLSAQRLLDQGSYLIEYMSKQLRMAKEQINDPNSNCLLPKGSNYYWLDPIPGTQKPGIWFKKYVSSDTPPVCRAFFCDFATNPNIGQLKEYQEGRNPAILAITSPEVEVNCAKFVPPTIIDSPSQPKITIYLEIKGKGTDPQPKIQLQTTISQRDLNK